MLFVLLAIFILNLIFGAIGCVTDSLTRATGTNAWNAILSIVAIVIIICSWCFQ